ncbi:MAG: NUDIX hydrolase [Anaerolineales bacterium]|nr:NUDIX hydrolase [Anaerolineales bacterium]
MDHYCSQCGALLVRQSLGGRERPACPSCGHVAWSHFSLSVGGLLVQQGRVLLVQRNLEPDAGQWTLPGGYVETDETLNQAVVREFGEETGLEVRPTGLLAIWQTPDSDLNSSWCVFGVELTCENQTLYPDPVEVRQGATSAWRR